MHPLAHPMHASVGAGPEGTGRPIKTFLGGPEVLTAAISNCL